MTRKLPRVRLRSRKLQLLNVYKIGYSGKDDWNVMHKNTITEQSLKRWGGTLESFSQFCL